MLIQCEAYGLDGDGAASGLLEEGAQDPGRDEPTTTCSKKRYVNCYNILTEA
jgi:hypothetical protein